MMEDAMTPLDDEDVEEEAEEEVLKVINEVTKGKSFSSSSLLIHLVSHMIAAFFQTIRYP